MTGNSNAASGGGGSNLAVAWVYDYTDKWPFVFEDGMTWSEYISSEYRFYDGTNGFFLSATSSRVTYQSRTASGATGSAYIYADGTFCKGADKITPDFQYIKSV